MNNDIVVKVEDLHKKFCRSLRRSMFYGAADVLGGICGFSSNATKLRQSEFWALEGIDFELRRGETLAIIGQNGSGKSTLLRLLNGIFPPDKGRISLRGNIGALIALGAGFHPHMTGRENIFLNGAILGMTKKEIMSKYDDIVDFADIGDFLEAPVSTYSSGMTVRLGFAIAIHSVPEILLIDEVLAVGDINFQKKCYEKILSLRSTGVSTIVVSHSVSAVERLCETGLLLHHGKQIYHGEILGCVKRYMELVNEENRNKGSAKEKEIVGLGNIMFSDVHVFQEGGSITNSDIEFGKNIIIQFKYRCLKKIDDKYQLRVSIRTYDGHDVQKFIFQGSSFSTGCSYENEKIIRLDLEGICTLRVLNPKLFPQTFRLDIALSSLRYDLHEGGLANAAVFRITEPNDKKMYFEYGNMTIVEFDHDISLM